MLRITVNKKKDHLFEAIYKKQWITEFRYNWNYGIYQHFKRIFRPWA